MSTLYNELLENGFSPVLNFKNDGYTKVLHIENFGEDVRLSTLGQVNLLNLTLKKQNQTLKAITGGTRVHLSVSEGSSNSEEPTISCANATDQMVIRTGYNGSPDDSTSIIINDTKFTLVKSTDESPSWYSGLANLITQSDVVAFCQALNLSVSFDSSPAVRFVLMDGTVTSTVRITIIPETDDARSQLDISVATDPESIFYNPTATQDPDTKIITFCLAAPTGGE